MSEGRQFRFDEMKPYDFPFTVKFYRKSDNELVHTLDVSGPSSVEVPYLAGEHGPVNVELHMPNGKVHKSSL